MKLRLRWSELISHVPCGGSPSDPAGQLIIVAELKELDGPSGILGQVGKAGERHADERMILGQFWGGLSTDDSGRVEMSMHVADCPQIITTSICSLLHARALWALFGDTGRSRRHLEWLPGNYLQRVHAVRHRRHRSHGAGGRAGGCDFTRNGTRHWYRVSVLYYCIILKTCIHTMYGLFVCLRS